MKSSLRFAILAVACALLMPSFAHALLFRAYVASTGNDSNPCTVAAPCRLLHAALNAVVDGGEIWILDSANFNTGTVQITKSVSIIGAPGQLASILTLNGSSGIRVDAPSGKVALRNIMVTDSVTNPGYEGIWVGNDVKLSIEDCSFTNLAYEAIYADTLANNSSVVHVKNSVFRNVGGVRGSTYWVAVRANRGVAIDISNSQFFSTGGVMVLADGQAATTTINLTDSYLSDGFHGAAAATGSAGVKASVYVTRTTFHGIMYPLSAQTTGVGTATVTVSDSVSVGNYYGFWQNGAGSSIVSLGNNHITDNSFTTGTLTTAARQ
jgi:hypothetical protein